MAEADLSAAKCLLRGVSCVSPRGKYDVAVFEDRLTLLAKGNVPALTLPLDAVEHILARCCVCAARYTRVASDCGSCSQLLEKPPDAGAKASTRTVYFMLSLLPDRVAEFGKQKLGVLLLSCTTAESLSTTHPSTGAPLAGPAPEVLAQAFGCVRAV